MSSGGALNIAQELAAIRAEQAKKFAAYKAAQATEVEEDDDVIIVGDTRVEQKGVKAQGKRPAEGSLKEGKKAKVEVSPLPFLRVDISADFHLTSTIRLLQPHLPKRNTSNHASSSLVRLVVWKAR